MVKNIIVSICLIFLFGCFEIYYKNPQPRGGKVFNGNLKQMFISVIPTKVNSNDKNSILNKITNDTLKFIEIRNKQKHLEFELQFNNGTIINEKFIAEDIVEDISDSMMSMNSIFNVVFANSLEPETASDQLTVLEKENIICINQKISFKEIVNGDEVYRIPLIITRDRSHNDFRFIFFTPFWLEEDKKINHIMKQLNVIEHSNSLLLADPNYIAFSNFLKPNDYAFEMSFNNILVLSLFDEVKKKIESKSEKYNDIKGFINYEEIEQLIIFSKNKNKLFIDGLKELGNLFKKLDKK